MSGNKKDKSRETKSVYFGLTDSFDVELLNHAKQINPLTGKERNFSRYIKRLIEEDMKRAKYGGSNSNGTSVPQYNTPVVEEDYSEEKKEAMMSFF